MKTNLRGFQRQRGATLVIALIMLVVLTLFAVTGFNLSSVNLRIAGNYQDQKYLESLAQQAIEQVISTATPFSLTPAAQTITISGYNVSVTAPKCNYYVTAKGYTKKVGEVAPEDADWEIRAAVADATSGAQAAIVQGVRMRQLPGNCPA
ncbi:MAG: pilus assembly PilX family protein [Betaproteobacteria bacterium]